MESLKREILDLLEKDLEFRYAIAGYLGLSEVLKRLDSIAEEQRNLREEQTKIWREIASIREEQVRLREETNRLWMEVKGLREEQVRLREEQVRLGEEQVKLREETNRLWMEVKGLREDFNKIVSVIDRIDIRLSRVERTLEKLTVDVEDEAGSVVKHRLKEIGINVELTSLIMPDLELNIYGISDDVCVVGEATVRAGAGLVEELLSKLNKLRENYPEKLRKKIIIVIYASLPMVELVERAKEAKIWLLKATEEFYRPEELFHEC